MKTIECYKCGIVFGVPDRWQQRRLEDGTSFWCPNGHQQSYCEPLAEKYRRERDSLKQQQARLEGELEMERRSAAAYKGQVTKLKKRASTGTCPCCNRHFDNLQRHMETKHPELVDHKVVPLRA